MMEEIFGADRQAGFAWGHWRNLAGLRTAVFSYQARPESSRYSVCCSPTTVRRDNHMCDWVLVRQCS
jgi:hypothetical protein